MLTSFFAELNPLEPSYLTNRAASYMALKRFRPALEDCQAAATLQSASPSAKTLLRLAKCQLAIGSSSPALSTIRTLLALEPSNSQAIILRDKVQQLESHVKTFEQARRKKDWGLARLALDKCLQAIEGEGGDVPPEWRCWRIELELAKGNWEAANMSAKWVLFEISQIRSTRFMIFLLCQ
jgi:DnaJ family protein C protein 7